jgi:hypothetical protein
MHKLAAIDAINSTECDLSPLGHMVADVRVEVKGLSQVAVSTCEEEWEYSSSYTLKIRSSTCS